MNGKPEVARATPRQMVDARTAFPRKLSLPFRGVAENEEGFFVSSRDSAMREKGALNEAARRRPPGPPTMGIDGSS